MKHDPDKGILVCDDCEKPFQVHLMFNKRIPTVRIQCPDCDQGYEYAAQWKHSKPMKRWVLKSLQIKARQTNYPRQRRSYKK